MSPESTAKPNVRWITELGVGWECPGEQPERAGYVGWSVVSFPVFNLMTFFCALLATSRSEIPTRDQIGGILDKTNAYKAKDIGADRDLVQVIFIVFICFDFKIHMKSPVLKSI